MCMGKKSRGLKKINSWSFDILIFRAKRNIHFTSFLRFSSNFFRTSASEKQETNANVSLPILPQKNPRTCQNTAVFYGFLPFEGAMLAFRTKLSWTWIFNNGRPITERGLAEYIVSCSRSVNFLIFVKFLLVGTWAIFPVFSLHLFGFCVCFSSAYSFLREDLSEADNFFVADNKIPFIQQLSRT